MGEEAVKRQLKILIENFITPSKLESIHIYSGTGLCSAYFSPSGLGGQFLTDIYAVPKWIYSFILTNLKFIKYLLFVRNWVTHSK